VPDFRLERLFRTPTSEQWSVRVEDDGSPVARVDVHFGPQSARVTVSSSEDLDAEATEALIALVDERLVPAKTRGNVRITLWRGRHEGTFVPD
jgi:hypothetical protein